MDDAETIKSEGSTSRIIMLEDEMSLIKGPAESFLSSGIIKEFRLQPNCN